MPKPDGSPTIKETKMAYHLAQGKNQVDAYLAAGYSTPRAKRTSQIINGGKIAHRESTQREVQRWLRELLPIGTMQEELMFCLRNLKSLAFTAEDERVRLMATLKLYEICEKREEAEREQARSDRTRVEVMSDLQSLYRKALEQPIVEAVIDEEPAAAAGAAGTS